MSGTTWWMLAAVAGELLLLLLVFLSIAWFRNRAARRRDVEAMATLVARVRRSKAERYATLQGFVKEKLDLAEDAQRPLVAALSRAELVLLQNFLATYRDRDASTAVQFDRAVYAALAPYQQLSGSVEVVEDSPRPAVEIAPTDTAELEALRKENQRLSDELKITMETMSRMLNEYSTMFSGGEPVAVTPIAATLSNPLDQSQQARQPPSPGAADKSAADDVVVDFLGDESSDQDVVQVDVEIQPTAVGEQDFDGDNNIDDAAAVDGTWNAVDDVLQHVATEAEAELPGAGAPVSANDAAAEDIDDVDEIFELAARGEVEEPSREGRKVDTQTSPTAAEAVGSVDIDVEAKPKRVASAPEQARRDTAGVAGDNALLDGDASGEVAGALNDVELDKGDDVDVVSELLVAGETEFVTPEGAEADDQNNDEGLFDSTEESLFDSVDAEEDQRAMFDEASSADVAAELDDLFDADQPLPDQSSDSSAGSKRQA